MDIERTLEVQLRQGLFFLLDEVLKTAIIICTHKNDLILVWMFSVANPLLMLIANGNCEHGRLDSHFLYDMEIDEFELNHDKFKYILNILT